MEAPRGDSDGVPHGDAHGGESVDEAGGSVHAWQFLAYVSLPRLLVL